MPRRSPSPLPADLELDALPGHLIRRLQQAAVAHFMAHTAGQDLTPVQFAALAAVQRRPSMDQRTLARTIGFDTSTTGGVVDRLEARGLLQRQSSPQDRRVRLLAITPEGSSVLAAALPGMLQAQEAILAPLNAADRPRFMKMLHTLVAGSPPGGGAPGDGST
jgi:DNA-binding MarR family transcriptional regulator